LTDVFGCGTMPRSMNNHSTIHAALAAILTGLLLVGFAPREARADRRYFLLTYTPYLDPRGETEVELWGASLRGKQDPAEGAALESRLEVEHGFTSRFTAAAYLNFARPAGGAFQFESPSLELICQPVRSGRVFGDPALYLEVTESGDELELEPKLLLARRTKRWLTALNLVGEFEFRHDDQERLPGGEILHDAFAGEINAGVAYGVGRRVALGLEVRGRSEHPNFGRQAASLISIGPTLNVQLGEAQVAVGVLPQIRGTPTTAGSRNLDDFERTQVRVVVGFEL
jgi:hypothetical protein